MREEKGVVFLTTATILNEKKFPPNASLCFLSTTLDSPPLLLQDSSFFLFT